MPRGGRQRHEQKKNRTRDEPVIDPCTLLTLFAAIFRATTTPTLGKLAGELLPFAAFIISTLSNAAFRVVFPAQVAHHHTRPVLHVLGMMPDREFFNQRENVKVVRLQVFFVLVALRLIIHRRSRSWHNAIERLQFPVDFESWNQMSVLKVMAKVTIFGNIGEKLE